MNGCFLRGFIAEGASFNLSKDWQCQSIGLYLAGRSITSQPIDGPLLELLESNFSCWGDFVQIEPVRVILLFVRGRSELLLFVVEYISTLWINPTVIMPDHCALSIEQAREISISLFGL